jgi:hypothetical protein
MNLFQVLWLAIPCGLSFLFWKFFFQQHGAWVVVPSIVFGVGVFTLFNLIMMRIWPGKEKVE